MNKYYIVNEIDKPCERLVMQRVDGGLYYLDPRTRAANDANFIDCLETATPLEDFGFQIIESNGLVRFEKINDSVAKYSNGTIRQWQGEIRFAYKTIVEQEAEKTDGEKEYLGDGVYVTHDGYHIVLTTENGMAVTNRIYLDRDVYQSLVDYVAKKRGS